MTILRNTFINEFRRRKARPSDVDFEQVAERPANDALYGDDPGGDLFDRLIDRNVLDAIQDLPEDFRVSLILSDLEGLTYHEIADLLDIPVGTVKSRLFRARKRLQQRLYEYAREMGYIRGS